MEINKKSSRETEDIKAKKKVLLEILEKLYKGCVIHCHYISDLDQFFVCCYVDKHDDDAYFTIKFDYDEV